MAGIQDVAKELNVAIIGGGYAGMAAAVTLASHGIRVTVLESAKQLGGRARGVQYTDAAHNNIQLDNGQHILLGCYHHTLQLIEKTGGNIAQDFLRLPLQLTLYNCFELKAPRLPAPLHLLTGLLTAKGLSFMACLRSTRFMLAMRFRKFKLHQDMNAYTLLQQYGQDDELIRLMWEPICISALNTPLRKASAQILLNVLRDSLNGSRNDSDMLLPRIDFTALFPQRAAQYLSKHNGKVLTSCGVENIISHGDEVELLTTQGNMRFSHVICAASPASSARLFRAVPALADIAEQIEAISYQPIYTVYLQYPAHVVMPHPMLGLDRCYTQWLFDKGQISAQHGLIAAVISAEGLHQELTHELLAKKVMQELHEKFEIDEIPLWHKVIAEKRATFACEVGLHRPNHDTPFDNILLAGDYTANDYPATLEGAVISGTQSAMLLLSRQPSAPSCHTYTYGSI